MLLPVAKNNSYVHNENSYVFYDPENPLALLKRRPCHDNFHNNNHRSFILFFELYIEEQLFVLENDSCKNC